VLVFFAAQFVAFFDWTNLGLILAVEGAEFLNSAGLHQVPLMLSFMLLGWPVGPGVPTALPSGAPAAP
jgi:aminobenzoyl-glutamate transport protein